MRNTIVMRARAHCRSAHRPARKDIARGFLLTGIGLMLSLTALCATAQVAYSPVIIEKPASGCGITYVEHESGVCIHLDALTDDSDHINQLVKDFRAGQTRKGDELHRAAAKVKLDRASLAKLGPSGMEFRCKANRLRLQKLEAAAENGTPADPEKLKAVQAKVKQYCITTVSR